MTKQTTSKIYNKMASPKLFFVIKDSCLVPVQGQNPILDTIFKNPKVRDLNKKGYSNAIKEFIKKNERSYNIYASTDYGWNGKETFRFGTLTECSELEYIESQTYKAKDFRPLEVYEVGKGNEEPIISKEVPVENNGNIDSSIIDTKKSGKSFIEEMRYKYPKPTIRECGMHIEKFTWEYLVRNILKQKNMILVGPTGTGKTELVMKAAEILKIDCHVYDMGSMQDPLTDLLGSHRLENGSSIFDYAKFTEHIQKPGIIVLDELSRAPLMANNILFPCLDSRRELPIEIADSKSARNIKVHPECVFIATANIGIEYSGTNDIDAALLNRFLPIRLDYMAPNYEIDVIMVRTGVSNEQAVKIVNFANRIRKSYREQTISKSCSTREVIAMAEMVADGFSYIEAFTAIVLHKYTDDQDDELNIIQKIMISL